MTQYKDIVEQRKKELKQEKLDKQRKYKTEIIIDEVKNDKSRTNGQ